MALTKNWNMICGLALIMVMIADDYLLGMWGFRYKCKETNHEAIVALCPCVIIVIISFLLSQLL